MKQFDKYRMVDGATPLAARYFNPVWQDIDLRLASLEEVKIAWQSAVDEVVKFGLVRIDELINEPLQAVLALSSQAESTSAELEQLRQLAEARTAALATLIGTLKADTEAQIADYIDAANSHIAAHEGAALADITAWKSERMIELEGWVASYEARLLAARQDIDNAIAELTSRVSGLELHTYSKGKLTIDSSRSIDRNATFGAATICIALLRAGGGSGAAVVQGSSEVAGGEGGNSAMFVIEIAGLPASIPCVVGAGGASVTTTATSSFGNPGGDTSFAGYSVKGGVGADGQFGASNIDNKAGDGGAGAGNGSNVPSAVNIRRVTGPAMPSVNGGGGGGSALQPTPGSSVTGGRGGAGLAATVTGQKAEDGVAPGGGGGGCRLLGTAGTATSGAGARGNIELWWY